MPSITPEQQQRLQELAGDPVLFCRGFFDIVPTEYQAAFLRDESKRIVLRWSRQSGKSTFLAVRALYQAIRNPRTVTIIVSPSLRQSMITRDKIEDLINAIPPDVSRHIFRRVLRTTIVTWHNSRIVALPNAEHLLRGFTADLIICDEASFFDNDETIFQNVLLPMLATTDGTLIVSSTPWGRNCSFYRFSTDPQWSQHHVNYQQAIQSGLIGQAFIEEMRQAQTPDQFKREFEAEFTEEVDIWLPQDLLTRSIDSDLELLRLDQLHASLGGPFCLGVDFGKTQDYSIVTAIQAQRHEPTLYRLIHYHRFKLGTPYAAVIGYVKKLCDQLQTVHKVTCDQTGVGDYIVEDMQRGGIPSVEGIAFTAQTKESLATLMKQRLLNNTLQIPYNRELLTELNVERYELTKTGTTIYSHPQGTHDDLFWSTALAVWGTRAPPLGKPQIDFARLKDK